jgi:hypothetical protein
MTRLRLAQLGHSAGRCGRRADEIGRHRHHFQKSNQRLGSVNIRRVAIA